MRTDTLHGNITPGPWRVKAGDEYGIEGANGDSVLLIGDNRRLIPMLPDEALILAAPKLLAALKKTYYELNALRARCGVPYWPNGRSDVDPAYFSSVVDEAGQAIDEAEGKQ